MRCPHGYGLNDCETCIDATHAARQYTQRQKEAKTWTLCTDELPPENTVVDTKIFDIQGSRNEQPLKRQGRLWWVEDGSMYVYYTPTHWRHRERPVDRL